MSLDYIACKNVSHVLDLLRLARQSGMRASYHPQGGIDAHRCRSVYHIVWVLGEPKVVEAFCRRYGHTV